jgi:hypothetical protein
MLRLGHFAASRWQTGSESDGIDEIFVGGKGLERGASEVLATLLHEPRTPSLASTHVELDKACERSRVLSRTSRDGVGGENVAPCLPGFTYEPRDASFLGKPVDYVIFDGLDAGDLRRSCSLSQDGPVGDDQARSADPAGGAEGRIAHCVVRLDRGEGEAIAVPARELPAARPTDTASDPGRLRREGT